MVFKIEKNKNYTVMGNYHLRDKNLSLKAKGLLSFMLSLPDTWDYSLNGLIAVCKEQESAIKSTLKELKEHGYLVIEKSRVEKGYFDYNYIIYEIPLNLEREKDNPQVENPPMDIPMLDNQGQINTKKEKDILTNDLVKRGYLEDSDVEKVFYDDLFEEILKGNDFKDIVIISHYIISRVLERKFIDENGEAIENKFGYYKESMINNIDKMKNNEIEWDEELGWFKDSKDDFDLEI